MNNELIEAQVIAVRIACGRLTALGLKTLQDSVEQACSLPAAFGWERKAAAHAEIFNVLADAAGDLVVGPVLRSGVGLSHDLMIAAGRCAGGMIASSRQRWLACLRAGDVEGAVAEMGKHLRVLNCMYRIASPRGTQWGRGERHVPTASGLLGSFDDYPGEFDA
jgi:DNA-binding FadR family transcriptional regulator